MHKSDFVARYFRQAPLCASGNGRGSSANPKNPRPLTKGAMKIRMRIFKASAAHTRGELRAGKIRLRRGKEPTSRNELCVIAFRANARRPQKMLCHGTSWVSPGVEIGGVLALESGMSAKSCQNGIQLLMAR